MLSGRTATRPHTSSPIHIWFLLVPKKPPPNGAGQNAKRTVVDKPMADVMVGRKEKEKFNSKTLTLELSTYVELT